MVLIEGRFIFLATPATASRSMMYALVNHCGGKFLSKTHHAHMSDMPLLREYSEPVYTMIRDPYDYVLSRYFYKYKFPENRSDEILEKFIPKYSLESHSSPSGSIMCMYRGFIDRYFLFEDGPEAFFEEVGLGGTEVGEIGLRNCPTLGKRLKIEDVDPKVKALIDQHFAEELELYRKVKEQASQEFLKAS
jgi:hypothetical protein